MRNCLGVFSKEIREIDDYVALYLIPLAIPQKIKKKYCLFFLWHCGLLKEGTECKPVQKQ